MMKRMNKLKIMNLKQITILLTCFLLSASFVSAQEINKYDDIIFVSTEQEARFVGGEDSMMRFVAKNIHYPQIASDAGISGMVYIEFIVNKDGSITKGKIVRDIGGGCGKEALRVIKTMPNWFPAQNNGHKVRSYFTLPISFVLDEGKPKVK